MSAALSSPPSHDGARGTRRSGGLRSTLLERFSSQIEKVASGCWIWTGGVNGRAGYGQLHDRGSVVLAHRFAYEHFVGPIPAGKQIDHKCFNRLCANPDHLEPVTPFENSRRFNAARRSGAITGRRKRKESPRRGFVTARQLEFLAVVAGLIDSGGIAPTVRELCDRCDLSSTNGVHEKLNALIREGALEGSRMKARALRVTEAGRRMLLGLKTSADAIAKQIDEEISKLKVEPKEEAA